MWGKMNSKDPADYIIEKYIDKSHLNPHTLDYSAYRVREWNPKSKTYDVYDGFSTAAVIRVLLMKHGVEDIDAVPLVDLTEMEVS